MSTALDKGGTGLAESRASPPPWLHALGSQLVPRPRLVARLRDAADSPLVILTAPAGYGKTTVLTEWAAEDERPFAWITLDGADNDPAALVSSIVEELERIEPVASEVLAALSAPEPSISTIVLPRLGRALASRNVPFVLVLDDVHTLKGREALDLVTAIADHLPPEAQLALASRTEPPLGLGRMRAQHRLLEFHHRDLAMTRSEGHELLESMGLGLDAADLETLFERTEGWPVALYLAGLSLLDQPEIGEAVARFAGDDRVIVDYLRDEFLSRISPDTLEFLTRTSVIDLLTGPVCDTVLERSDSARMLRDLARSNTLIVPLDHRDRTFRYHALFAEMLRAELDRLDPQLAAELHGRARDWYAEHRDYDRAVPHAISAGDVERAGRIIFESVPALMTRGRNATIRRWLEQFTDEQLAGSAPLTVTAAHSDLARGEGSHAEHWTSVAEARLDHTVPPELKPAVEAGMLLARAELGRDGVDRMAGDAARAAALLDEDDPWRSVSCMVEGIASHLRGDRERARKKLEEGARRGAVATPFIEVLCVAQLALLAVDEDDREEATALAARARGQIERSGLADYESAAFAFAVSALVRTLDGRVEDARADAEQSIRLLERLADFAPWFEAETRLALARARLRLDDVEAARTLLAGASRSLRQMPDAAVLREWVQDTWAAIDSSAAAVASGRLGLTPAELRVLQHLPTHLSFREIAERLFVSTNTVKTQARAVYRKLDVSSRAEAVERAQQAGLLDPERPSPEVD